ncbi:MAG: HIT family protein [Methanobacterium sp.]|nr:HIT family protein [Methanobacterium sp.]
MMTDNCEYCQLAGGYGELIEETPYWMIFLAPSQRYLGTCVVALKKKRANLSEVNDAEWDDFVQIVRKMEDSVNKSFKPNLFNWSCFKNAAFRKDNDDVDPEIHWHFIPRYQETVLFCGVKFDDPDFGHIPQPIARKVSSEVMNNIKLEIKKNLLE